MQADGYSQFEASFDGTTAYIAMQDAHSDTTDLINATTLADHKYQYDAYGNEVVTPSGVANPFRYCSQYYDEETGLYYLRARYYDPSIGLFTQQDSYLGEDSNPQSLNLYGYCWGNPVGMWDLSGMATYSKNKNGTYKGCVGFGVQICFSIYVAMISSFAGVEFIWFLCKIILKKIIPWAYYFGGFSCGIALDFNKLISPKLFSNPKTMMQSLGFGVDVTATICVFVVTAKSLKNPNDYLGEFAFQNITAFGITASHAFDPKKNIQTYGIGVSCSLKAFPPSFSFTTFGIGTGVSRYKSLGKKYEKAQSLYATVKLKSKEVKSK